MLHVPFVHSLAMIVSFAVQLHFVVSPHMNGSFVSQAFSLVVVQNGKPELTPPLTEFRSALSKLTTVILDNFNFLLMSLIFFIVSPFLPLCGASFGRAVRGDDGQRGSFFYDTVSGIYILAQ